MTDFTIEAVRDDGNRRRLTVPATGEPLLFPTHDAAERKAAHLHEILAPSEQHHIRYAVMPYDAAPRRVPVEGDRIYHRPVGGLAEYGTVEEITPGHLVVHWDDHDVRTRVPPNLLEDSPWPHHSWGYQDELTDG